MRTHAKSRRKERHRRKAARTDAVKLQARGKGDPSALKAPTPPIPFALGAVVEGNPYTAGGMDSCNHLHELVFYIGTTCPVCDEQEENQELQNEVDWLNGQLSDREGDDD